MARRDESGFDLDDRLDIVEFLLKQKGFTDQDLDLVTQAYQLRRQPEVAFVHLDVEQRIVPDSGTPLGSVVFTRPFSNESVAKQYLDEYFNAGMRHRVEVGLRQTEMGNSHLADIEGFTLVLYGALPYVTHVQESASDDDIPF